MRTLIIMLMFGVSLVHAAWDDYEEVRELQLDAASIGELKIDAGAGSLEIEGDDGTREISVTATILVPGKNEDKAREVIEDHLVLTLELDGDSAVLKGYFDDSSWGWDDSPSVHLEVSVPRRLSLDVEDSSGSLVVRGIGGDVSVDDSSGSIKMSDLGGEVDIEDGSGSITVEGIGGSISIDDGSGSIRVEEVVGSVTIEDGSGSITVDGVGEDLIIVDDGSGSINYRDVQGRVEDNS